MESSSSPQATPRLSVSPKKTEATAQTGGVLRPNNSNTSSGNNSNSNANNNSNNNSNNANNSKPAVSSPIGPSPTILKEPPIIDLDPKTFQQPSVPASDTSREGLKKQVERRRMTLTLPERNFLDHLCVHGNEVEVQLAYERLGDEDLFFDWQTPRHLKASENRAPEEVFDDNQESSSRYTEDHTEGDDANDGDLATPRPETMRERTLSVGSQRRLQILEDRKSHKSPLWQAHESGIAVTHAASKKSIFKRTSSAVSILSNGSAATPQMIRDSSRFSFASTATGASAAAGGEPMEMIFRRIDASNSNKMRAASPLQKARYQRSHSLTFGSTNMHQQYQYQQQQQQQYHPSVPPPRGFLQQRRASTSSRKSVTFSSQTPPMTRRKSASAFLRRSNSDGKLALSQSGRPPSGRPPLAQRSESMASVPSIHHASPLRSESIGSIPSIHHANAIRSPSIGSIPSIRHGTAIRSPSNATESSNGIPSIRHANALRSQSISSIPSIHHATALRSPSISSIPSIHHANAIRSDSVTTATGGASMHHQHYPMSRVELFQDDSHVVSGTFPPVVDLEALDHSLMDDTDNEDDPLSPGGSTHSRKKVFDHQNSLLASTNGNKMLDHQNSLLASTRRAETERSQELLPAYSATPDIASAWLSQQKGHFLSKPFEFQSQDSFPPAIQIPSTITDKTDRSTMSSKSDEAAFVIDKKAVLVRRTSRNSQYDGEGMEVTEMPEMEYDDSDPRAYPMWENMSSIRQCTSFDDETMSLYSHRQNNFDEVFRRSIRRTFSDEEVVAANMMVGDGSNVTMFREISNMTMSKREVVNDDDSDDDDGASWDLQSQSGEDQRFDSWNIVKDEYVNGYGGGGSLDFMILGTCADDLSASPHVLSPPMMESLAAFLPHSQSTENFFLRYSLVRDGASMLTFLKRSRGVQYGILALETVDGEVFGCFTGQPWRKSPSYFGTGESFLWKMRRSRLEATNDILEQAQLESEIDVYPHTGDNQYYQLCTHDRIAVGGGTPSGEKKTSDPPFNPHEWGFGLDIQGDLLVGTSSPCATFDSPSLSKVHSDGSLFEIVNLELWALTPCTSVQEAEHLELGKLFLERQ